MLHRASRLGLIHDTAALFGHSATCTLHSESNSQWDPRLGRFSIVSWRQAAFWRNAVVNVELHPDSSPDTHPDSSPDMHPESSPDMRPWKEESKCCGALLTIPKVKVVVGNRPIRGKDNVVRPRPHNIDRSAPWRLGEQNNFKTTAECSVSVA